MNKKKIFISSVQSEFSEERRALVAYIRQDAMLGRYFEPFIFEELPAQAVTEAIVNAMVHRDYTSTGSVQVMLFRDRLEVWNPGTLPKGLTIEKLQGRHRSMPTNPLLARPMFVQDDDFLLTLYRRTPKLFPKIPRKRLNDAQCTMHNA